jgi:hypothetical protein
MENIEHNNIHMSGQPPQIIQARDIAIGASGFDSA